MKTVKLSKSAGKTRAAMKKKSPVLGFKSRGAAEVEISKLRQNRERLESAPPTGDSDARASLL